MKLGIETTNFHKYLYVEEGAKRRYFTLEEIKNKPQNFVQGVNYRLNKQSEQIRSLEEQLNDAKEEIERREIYFISWLNNNICKGYVCGYDEESKFCIISGEDMISAKEIFATREEALKRLAELEGK